MLDYYFRRPSRIRSLRASPSGPFLDGFATWLRDAGFSLGAGRCYLLAAEHLGVWLARRRIEITEVEDPVIDRFVKHLASCRCSGAKHDGYPRVDFRVRTFVSHLRHIGAVPPCERVLSRRETLLEEYGEWMRRRQGAQETSVQRRRLVLDAFLARLGVNSARYRAANIRKFVFDYVRDREPSAANVPQAVRGYLRFLVAQGRCAAELVDAVPRVPSIRLAPLPAYLPPGDIERTIAGCKADLVGVRDRAMLLLLARLGLRPSDVVRLRLDDIDWRQARLRVVGKGRREAWLPLPQDVGDALIAYLAAGGARADDEHVFVATNAPFGALHARSVSARAVLAMQRAGVQPPPRGGAYVFRHSLATRMLLEGATFDLIGTVLRHRRLETTAIYAKVDFTALRQIAQPWPLPEGMPC